MNASPPELAGTPAAPDSLHTLRSRVTALATLAALTLAMFGSVLLAPGDRVLSHANADLFQQFVHWRKFGFDELRHGNLALWNPHLFSGAPYFGGFQAALLYPPNVLFLFLPLARAINWSIALHVFLAGAFTYAWAARRRLHPVACLLSAVLFMFCGAHFLHIYAGHLPNLCSLVWAPLIFLAIDGLFETSVEGRVSKDGTAVRPSLGSRLGSCLIGEFAFAMQILAGHPQYVFYTGVAAAIYCALLTGLSIKNQWAAAARDAAAGAQTSSSPQSQSPPIDHPAPVTPLPFLLGLAAMVVGGLALSAVQLLTGLQESEETLRSPGLPYDFAAMFSFPPENFLTVLAPNFFGRFTPQSYWGRCYFWEMCPFVSLTGLALAVVGVILGRKQKRRCSLIMVVVLVGLALGVHTPLFKALYYCVPGFDKFRGTSKFMFLASLFVALLAGIGLDKLLSGWRVPRRFCVSVGAVAVLLAGACLSLGDASTPGTSPHRMWQNAMMAVRDTGQGYLPPASYDDPTFVLKVARQAANSLWLAAATLSAITCLLAFSAFGLPRARTRLAPLALAGLGILELFVFAHSSLDTFDLAQALSPQVKELLAQHPGDYRILNLRNPNAAMSLGAQDLWGYDPGVVRRYAQLLGFTQGVPPDQYTQLIAFARHHPLFDMLRCRFMLAPQGTKTTVYQTTNSLPRLQLVQRFQVIPQRDQLLAALTNATFNPREDVLLETAPSPAPQPSPVSGTVALADSSTDHLTIEADLKSPAIVLITDSFAKGWRVRPLQPSGQSHYEVLPANYCLRGIPLAAGHHRLRLEYSPLGFRVGKWISLGSLALYLSLVALAAKKRLQRP